MFINCIVLGVTFSSINVCLFPGLMKYILHVTFGFLGDTTHFRSAHQQISCYVCFRWNSYASNNFLYSVLLYFQCKNINFIWASDLYHELRTILTELAVNLMVTISGHTLFFTKEYQVVCSANHYWLSAFVNLYDHGLMFEHGQKELSWIANQ